MWKFIAGTASSHIKFKFAPTEKFVYPEAVSGPLTETSTRHDMTHQVAATVGSPNVVTINPSPTEVQAGDGFLAWHSTTQVNRGLNWYSLARQQRPDSASVK